MTQEDIILKQCLCEKQAELRARIDEGRQYVWELRLSLDDFHTMESAINNSINFPKLRKNLKMYHDLGQAESNFAFE